jgi:tetratricopeptide (TPR) repeat protein
VGGSPPRDVMPLAKENVLRALQLDDSLSAAHVLLGHIHYNYDWDWKSAAKEFHQAVELNPNNSNAYLINGLCEASLGHKDASLESFRNLQKLDAGYSPASVFPIGIAHYWMRDYDEALKYFQKSLEMDPRTPSPNFWMGATYLEKKDYPKAQASFQRAVNLNSSPVTLMGLGICYARQGNPKAAEAIVSQILELSKQTYIPEFYFACLYANMGRKDEAFEWLNKGYEARANGMPLIRVIPLLDSLRSDPRFSELLVRMNLQ